MSQTHIQTLTDMLAFEEAGELRAKVGMDVAIAHTRLPRNCQCLEHDPNLEVERNRKQLLVYQKRASALRYALGEIQCPQSTSPPTKANPES